MANAIASFVREMVFPGVLAALLLASITVSAQGAYPARVVDGPNFLMDLYHLETEAGIVRQVPHLKSIQVEFGLANWEWSVPKAYFCDLTSLKLHIQPIQITSFIMYMPGGGERRVKLEEAGISKDGGIMVEGIKLQVEFGNPGVIASVDMAIYGVPFGKAKVVSGDLKFSSDEDCKKVLDYINKHQGWSSVDPQISFISKGQYKNDFKNREIRQYIEKIYAESEKESKINALKAEAEQLASQGNIDEAIQKYRQAYALKNDPDIKSKIEALQTQQEAAENKDKAESLLSQARDAESRGDLEKAKQLYQEAASQSGDANIQNDIDRVGHAMASDATSPSQSNQPQYNSPDQTGNNSGHSSGHAQNGYENTYERQQAMAEFNRKQQAVGQWMKDFDQAIKTGEQDRLIKQQQYDQMAEGLANTVGSYLQKIDQAEEQKKINKRKRLIKDAVYQAYSPLYADLGFWSDFQKRLSNFANAHKNAIPKEGIDRLGSSMNTIQGTLEGIKSQLEEMKNNEAHSWQYVSDRNDIFAFPLREWKNKSYSIARPVIGYDLVILLGTGRAIPDRQERISFINDAASLIADVSVRLQNYDYVASTAHDFEKGGGTNARFKDLINSATAIKNYIQLRDEIQKQYDAFVADLKKRKGFVAIKNTNSKIHFGGIFPLVGAPQATQEEQQELEKLQLELNGIATKAATPGKGGTGNTPGKPKGQSMNSLFPRIDEVTQAYRALKGSIGEFQALYPTLTPEKTANFKAGGYYVEPGKIEISMSQKYMEPNLLKVPLEVAAGQQLEVDLADFANRFHIVSYFKPFSVDLNKERFQLEKTLFPSARNRKFPNGYKFNIAFTTYNFGISEVSTTLIGSKSYLGMRSYARSKTAFFTNFEVGRIFYGKGKVITGFETSDGSVFEHDITDMATFGADVAVGGIGVAQGLGENVILEVQTTASFLNYRAFKVNATQESKSNGEISTHTGSYPYDMLNYFGLHGRAGLNFRIGTTFLSVEYSVNYYPVKGESDQTLGDKGDISQLGKGYQESQTKFFEGIYKSYFNNSLTVNFLF